MKKHLAFTAALGLATTLTFTACEEKKKQDGTTATEAATQQPTQSIASGVKLLETITDESSGPLKFDYDKQTINDESSGTLKFEYDKQNRIVKIGNKTITYADNLITVGTKKYAINGKTITVDGKSFTINGDGYIVDIEGYEHKYKDGNVINCNNPDVDSYDDKKSPFSNSNTPKWLIQKLFDMELANKNNIVSNGCNYSTSQYEYDSDGFPVKKATYHECEEDCGPIIIRFTYRGGTK